MIMLQIKPKAWVNTDYIVGAILHDGEGTNKERTLTLTLSATSGLEGQFRYVDITGIWVGYVMRRLKMLQTVPKEEKGQ